METFGDSFAVSDEQVCTLSLASTDLALTGELRECAANEAGSRAVSTATGSSAK